MPCGPSFSCWIVFHEYATAPLRGIITGFCTKNCFDILFCQTDVDSSNTYIIDPVPRRRQPQRHVPRQQNRGQTTKNQQQAFAFHHMPKRFEQEETEKTEEKPFSALCFLCYLLFQFRFYRWNSRRSGSPSAR